MFFNKLTWVDNSNNETGFKIERKPLFSNLNWEHYTTVGANIFKYTMPDQDDAIGYYYRVRAVNAVGESAPSNELWCHCVNTGNGGEVNVTWVNTVNASTSGNNLTAIADSARGETTQTIISGNGSIIHTVDLNLCGYIPRSLLR